MDNVNVNNNDKAFDPDRVPTSPEVVPFYRRHYDLSDRQRLYLNEYLSCFSAQKAARKARVPYATARKWMGQPRMNHAIDIYLEKRRLENEDLVKRTLEQLQSVMCSDIREYAEWNGKKVNLFDSKKLKDTKCIKVIEKTARGVRVVLHDKVEAIRLMMMGLGMIKNQHNKHETEEDKNEDIGNNGITLIEALRLAHEQRRNMLKLTDGHISVATKTSMRIEKDIENGDAPPEN